METIDIEEFRDAAERFLACRTNSCNECQFYHTCAADIRTGNVKSITDKLANVLRIVLDRLDEQSQMPVDDFIALLKGE